MSEATESAKPAKAAKAAKAPKVAKASKDAAATVAKAAVRPSEKLINLLLAPHVSEKAARASEKHNQYVFRVRLEATKPEIAKAVELMFSVEVEAVQVVNVGGKKKRFGAAFGRRSDWKKAYVSLKSGQTIDLTGTAKA
jgi:large subunit ribosomal protein L23